MNVMKKYMDIPRFGHKKTANYFTDIASKNLDIRIGIKLDGSNGQFEVNEKGELLVYSRREILNEENNLRGFYQYIHSKVDPKRMPKGYKVFGEWLVQHKVQYPQNMYNHFYLFNVYDSTKGEYISPHSRVFKEISNYLVKELDMREEIVVYEGKYKGLDHIDKILKKVTREDEEYTNKTPEEIDDVFHEGIVIKSHNYRDRFNCQLFVKIVGEKFKEIKKVKYRDKKNKVDNSHESIIAEFTVTKARVEKILYKLVDESVLPIDFCMEDMKIIAKKLPKRVYEDIMKEELDTINEQFGEFNSKTIGKKIASKAIIVVKQIIEEKIEESLNKLK